MICAVCDHSDDRTVIVGVVNWLDGRGFQAVPRCVDRDACSVRCREASRVWPLAAVDRSRPPKVDPTTVAHVADEYETWARQQPPAVLDRRPPKIDPRTGRAAFPLPLSVPPVPAIPPAPEPARATQIVADGPETWW